MNRATLRILLIEDNLGDADLVREILDDVTDTDIELTHVEQLQQGIERLKAGAFDVILLDLSLPDAQGADTITQTHATSFDVPIVVLTGMNDEESAIAALRLGVQEYLIKGDLQEAGNTIKAPISSRRLMSAMRHAIERKRLENDKARLILELSEALANVKTLSDLLPICAGCKQIRDDNGYWSQVEAYISAHLDVGFSHSMCPGCMEKWYGDQLREIEGRDQSRLASGQNTQ